MRHLRLILLVLAALIVIAPAAHAAKCGDRIIDDYMNDGAVDGKYTQACYKAALGSIDPDSQDYSNAGVDIKAAMVRQALADKRTNTANNPPAPPVEEEPVDEPDPAVTPVDNNDPPDPQPQETEQPALEGEVDSTEQAVPLPEPEEPPTTIAEAIPDDTGAVLGTEAEVVAVGAEDDDGPLQQALREVGPSSGDDVPMPVMVLGGLAILLIAVGAGGLAMRRFQSR